jgi:transcriptional pleiotropic regulator of transition state genes
MKSLGTVRKIDELGRIVLPIETRRRLNLEPKDPVEIFVEKDRVVIKKYEPACIFCGEMNDIVDFKDRRICKKCLAEIQKAEI